MSDTASGFMSKGTPAAVKSAGLKGTMSNHDQKNDETSKATGEMLPTNLSSVAFMGTDYNLFALLSICSFERKPTLPPIAWGAAP